MMKDRWIRIYAMAMALALAYGAAVHLTNMLGFGGVDWLAWPLKWQVLDAVFLVVNIGLAWGLLAGAGWALAGLVAVLVVQIGLYTWGRDWVTDVPPGTVAPPGMAGDIDRLVIFLHVALVGLVLLVWLRMRRRG